LRPEYKECKDGILYNKPGFDNVLSVKTKLLSEEAIITSKKKKDSELTRATKAIEDEIALKLRETKLSTEKSTKEPADKALMFKGKGSKGDTNGKGQGKGRQWKEPEWTPQWGQPAQTASLPRAAWNNFGKGKGHGKSKGTEAPFDAQKLWCDIHQKYGHSTDWCFDNPQRTGGPPPQTAGFWCDSCKAYGHTANSCYANSPRPNDKGKGKPQHGKGKGKKGYSGERNWKSQNFPAGYSSDQATPALHDESFHKPPSQVSWWDENELGSSCLEEGNAENNETEFEPEYDDAVVSEEIDLYFLAVIKQIERQIEYVLAPTTDKLTEFNAHEEHLMRAARQLNIHSQRIVLTFREQVGYVGCMQTFIANQRSLEGVRMDRGFYMCEETKPTLDTTTKLELENDTHRNNRSNAVALFESELQLETILPSRTSRFSPRDRDIPAAPPLEGGPVLGIAGQASAVSLDSEPRTETNNLEFEIDTHLKRDNEIDTHRNDGFTAIALLESGSELSTETNNLEFEIDTHLKRDNEIDTHRNDGFTAITLLESGSELSTETNNLEFEIDTHLKRDNEIKKI
jgi:hypothetical protein